MSKKLPVTPVSKPKLYVLQVLGAASGTVTVLADDVEALAHAASMTRHLGKPVNAFSVAVGPRVVAKA